MQLLYSLRRKELWLVLAPEQAGEWETCLANPAVGIVAGTVLTRMDIINMAEAVPVRQGLEVCGVIRLHGHAVPKSHWKQEFRRLAEHAGFCRFMIPPMDK